MKKYIIFILMLVGMQAGVQNVSAAIYVDKISPDWHVIQFKDGFSDRGSCSLYSRGHGEKGVPSIVFTAYGLVFINSSGDALEVDGAGIKYRIDKHKTVELGEMYPRYNSKAYVMSVTEAITMLINFRKGNEVLFEVTSINPLTQSRSIRLSLAGFSKAYKATAKCNY